MCLIKLCVPKVVGHRKVMSKDDLCISKRCMLWFSYCWHCRKQSTDKNLAWLVSLNFSTACNWKIEIQTFNIVFTYFGLEPIYIHRSHKRINDLFRLPLFPGRKYFFTVKHLTCHRKRIWAIDFLCFFAIPCKVVCSKSGWSSKGDVQRRSLHPKGLYAVILILLALQKAISRCWFK